MNKTEPKTLSGFMELMPNEQIMFNKFKDTIIETYKSYGFLKNIIFIIVCFLFFNSTVVNKQNCADNYYIRNCYKCCKCRKKMNSYCNK